MDDDNADYNKYNNNNSRDLGF